MNKDVAKVVVKVAIGVALIAAGKVLVSKGLEEAGKKMLNN